MASLPCTPTFLDCFLSIRVGKGLSTARKPSNRSTIRLCARLSSTATASGRRRTKSLRVTCRARPTDRVTRCRTCCCSTGSTWRARRSGGWRMQHMILFDYKLHRASRYYFYERTYSPDAVGKITLAEGCGALNLVNVAEPLKVSRLLLGVDDLNPAFVRIVPRIPPDWKGVDAVNWPIWTGTAIVRAHIRFKRKGKGAQFTLQTSPGEQIGDLKVRMPSHKGYVWREVKNVRTVTFATE